MKIISIDILDAIHRMKLQLGTNTEIAKKFGVSSKHVGKILSKEVKYFEDKTWDRIKPLVTPYIRISTTNNLNLADDEIKIIQYFRKSENNKKRLELLIEIDDSNNNISKPNLKIKKPSSIEYETNDHSELQEVAEKENQYGKSDK